MNSGFKVLFLLTLTHHLLNVVTHPCLSPANFNNVVPFEEVLEEDRVNFMHNGRQVIMTSYQFQCCGNITAWQTFVHPFSDAYRNRVYSIYFQVWRPTSPGQDDGCFSLAGEDKYENIILIQESQGLVNRTVPESSIMNVQPGDVVGFFLSLSGGKEGSIQFSHDTEKGFDEEQGWFNELPLIVSSDTCPFPVGPDQILTASLRAAPLLSLDMDQFSCHGQTVTFPQTIEPVTSTDKDEPAKSTENNDLMNSFATAEPVNSIKTDGFAKSTESDAKSTEMIEITPLLVIGENGSSTGLIIALVILAALVFFMAVIVFTLVCLMVRKEINKKRLKARSGDKERNDYTSRDDLKNRAISYTNGNMNQDEDPTCGNEDIFSGGKEVFVVDNDTVNAKDDFGVIYEDQQETIQTSKSAANANHGNEEKATIEEAGDKICKEGDLSVPRCAQK